MPSSFVVATACRRAPVPHPALVLFLILCAVADRPRAEAAFDLPHPTVMTTAIDGAEFPVIGAKRDGAVIRVKDGTRTVSREVPFKYNRAWRFAPGRVDISGENAISTKAITKAGILTMGSMDMGVNYQAKLTASTTYPKAYAVLMFVDRAFMDGDNDVPALGVFFRNIGTLEANRPTNITIDVDWDKIPASLRPHLTFFPLLFNDGVEVRTNRELIAAAFFRRLELIGFRKALDAYLTENSFGDHPLKIYQSVPPCLPDEAAQQNLPSRVTVSFAVTEDGMVSDFKLEDSLPAAAAAAVRRAVQAWLFLPRLDGGYPKVTLVRTQVPLGLKAPAGN